MKASHAPKDGASRRENLSSQPHVVQRVFNNDRVLTQGWYPVCPASQIKPGQARSFKIFRQRIVVWRSESGVLHALDAFCPHMGADLGNGRVVGERLQCYFHQWELDGAGALKRVPCRARKPIDQVNKVNPAQQDQAGPSQQGKNGRDHDHENGLGDGLEQVRNRAYPISEAYGHLWVFSAPVATHALPSPPGLEGEPLSALFLKEITLFAHHHVMMANGVDLQHFATVHKLDIRFDYAVETGAGGVFDWTLRGPLPADSLKGRLARWLLGPEFEYRIRFAGGSIVTITYGSDQRFRGFKLPSLQILWGCLPQENGISKVRIFIVSKRREGLIGRLSNGLLYVLTLMLLTMLRDEDIGAFPHMRFNTHRLIKEDQSLARLIQLTNQLPLSDWGERAEGPAPASGETPLRSSDAVHDPVRDKVHDDIRDTVPDGSRA